MFATGDLIVAKIADIEGISVKMYLGVAIIANP